MNSEKHAPLSNLNIYYTKKNIKKPCQHNKFKIQLQREMEKLNYLMDHILYQIFNIILIIKKHKPVTDNPPIRIYIN